MSDLLSRLSSATGPSRELDAEIYELALSGKFGGAMPVLWWDEVALKWQPPRYTESIDSTLTLMPDGHWFAIETSGGTCYAVCGRAGHDGFDAYASTPAIALVIAILKAREDSKP